MVRDNVVGADAVHAPAQPAKWRLGGTLWLLGMPGVVAVVWALLPPLKANEALLPLPLWAVVLLSGLQTAVLLALAVAGAPGGARSAQAVGPGQRHAAGGQAAVWRHHRRAAGALGRDDPAAVAELAHGAARAGPAGQGAGGWRGAAQCAAVCAGASACRAGAGGRFDGARRGVCAGGQHGLWPVGRLALRAPRVGGGDPGACAGASVVIPVALMGLLDRRADARGNSPVTASCEN